MNDVNDVVCAETWYRTGILIVSKCPFGKDFNMCDCMDTTTFVASLESHF